MSSRVSPAARRPLNSDVLFFNSSSESADTAASKELILSTTGISLLISLSFFVPIIFFKKPNIFNFRLCAIINARNRV
jgi:hypothetical protein